MFELEIWHAGQKWGMRRWACPPREGEVVTVFNPEDGINTELVVTRITYKSVGYDMQGRCEVRVDTRMKGALE